MSNKFRASYSVLNTWAGGNWEMAIKMYFKLETFTSQAMADGKNHHERWESYIKENNRLPLEFGGKQLVKPICEEKIVVQLADWLELVGKIDCIDSPTIYEFKTGKQSSEAYASSPQAGVYAVLATYNKIYVDRAEIYHWDQYIKRADMSIVWVTDKMLNASYNWIVTLAGEMHNYFEKNKLYDQFGANLLKK